MSSSKEKLLDILRAAFLFMLSRVLRSFLFPLVSVCLFLLMPAADVFAVCCHCYFNQHPVAVRSQCIRIPELTSCDQAAIDTHVGTLPGVRTLLAGRADLRGFTCDRSPVSDTLCRAGTGAPGDRCDSRPPITLGELATVYPEPPAPGGGATNATNAPTGTGTNTTNNTTNNSSGGSGNQASARAYNQSVASFELSSVSSVSCFCSSLFGGAFST